MAYAAFRLACRLPHCRFDDDICTTAQAPLAAEGWRSGKQRHANRSKNLAALPTGADHRQLNSILLGSDCRLVKSQSGVAAESCNSETASDDQAAKRRAAS